MKVQTMDSDIHTGRTADSIARRLYGRDVGVVATRWGWEVVRFGDSGRGVTYVADLYRV